LLPGPGRDVVGPDLDGLSALDDDLLGSHGSVSVVVGRRVIGAMPLRK
jgi:hypothetical protein